MADRHVAGLVVADRQREAAEVRLHRIEVGGLGVDRDHADVVGARDPGVEPVERAHGLVFGAVDLLLAGFGGACGREGDGVRAGLSIGALCRAGGTIRANGPSRSGEQIAGGALQSGRGRRRTCDRHLMRRHLGARLDRAGVDAGLLDDAARQRGEFHRLQERDQVLVVRLVHREIRDRHVEIDMLVERDQLLGHSRRFGVLDQRLAALLLLDLAGARQQRFEVAVFDDELRRGLDADAGHAGHVVG